MKSKKEKWSELRGVWRWRQHWGWRRWSWDRRRIGGKRRWRKRSMCHVEDGYEGEQGEGEDRRKKKKNEEKEWIVRRKFPTRHSVQLFPPFFWIISFLLFYKKKVKPHSEIYGQNYLSMRWCVQFSKLHANIFFKNKLEFNFYIMCPQILERRLHIVSFCWFVLLCCLVQRPLSLNLYGSSGW